MKKKVSFPGLDKYHIPVSYLIKKTTDLEVVGPIPTTKKTLELGSKYSPDMVCVPFKYNLGNFIEALDNKVDVLLQIGGGCRCGYYREVQETILKDLGYKFSFYSIRENNTNGFKSMFKTFKKLNPNLSFLKFIHYLLVTLLMICYMDNTDEYIRRNIGFEVDKNSFKNLNRGMLKSFTKCNNIFSLTYSYLKYKRMFKKIKINKPKNCLRVGIIGELYTSMEPFSNYFLEETLASMNIEIKRYTNATYLLIKKMFCEAKMLRYVKKYIKYPIGADGLDNVYRAKKLIDKGYDGIIHIKPFGCTPEVSAIPIIKNVCNDYNMPIIFFSFDSETSTVLINTRLEAFYDMILMRKDGYNE